jgi:uncharacterized protein YnzC (UPF0291/DUF896 family)
MQDHEIERINELARKAADGELTEAETQERHALRRAYVDAMKASLRGHLENIRYVEDEH